MDKKTTDIVAYLTWVGLVIALVIGDRERSKFHLNQALVIWLAWSIFVIVGKVPLVGGIIGAVGRLFCLICCFIGLIGAIQGEEKPVPFLGQFKLLH